jgi:hypothetical protein
VVMLTCSIGQSNNTLGYCDACQRDEYSCQDRMSCNPLLIDRMAVLMMAHTTHCLLVRFIMHRSCRLLVAVVCNCIALAKRSVSCSSPTPGSPIASTTVSKPIANVGCIRFACWISKSRSKASRICVGMTGADGIGETVLADTRAVSVCLSVCLSV